MTDSITISIPRAQFADQLQVVARGLSGKNIIQTIDGILMESRDGKITLTATDLETQISANIDFSGPEIRTLLSTQTVDIIKALPGDHVVLKFDDGRVTITAGAGEGSSVQLPTLSPVDFPIFGQSDGTNDSDATFSVTVGEFKKALRQVIFAVSADINKQTFTRVNFGLVNDALQLAASDTYRLSTTTCPATRISGSDRDTLVPTKPLYEVLRFAQKLADDVIVKVICQDKSVAFEIGSVRIITRLGTETFPDIQKLIPTGFSGRLTVDTSAFRQALERAMILTEKGGTGVVALSTSAPSLVGVDLCISIKSAHGSLKERISAEYNGSGFSATFNARFLHEWLKICAGDQVQLQHNNVNQPCVALDTASPALRYLILPIRGDSR